MARHINWDDLRLFLTAVRAGSYSEAGRRLEINRTTVGRRVQALERALDHSLFELGETGYQPNQAGRRVLAAAREMEQAMEQLSAGLALAPRTLHGPLRVAAPIGLGPEFMPELAGFRRHYPAIRLELVNSQHPLQDISRRKADIALCVAPKLPEHLQGPRIATLTRALYATASYLAEYPPELDLQQHLWVGWGQELAQSGVARWMRSHLPEEVVIAAEVNSWQAMKEAVLAGLGVGALWCFLADADPRLKRIRPEQPELSTALWIATHRDIPLNERMHAFSHYLQPALSRRVLRGSVPANAP